MGISTEVWRFRIGAFLPANSGTPHQRERPLRKHRRTYKRPPSDAPTHHVTLEIFVCLVLLAIAVWTSVNMGKDPYFDIRQGAICVAVMTVKMCLNQRLRFQRTWRVYQGTLRYILLILAAAYWTSEEHHSKDNTEQRVAWEAVIPLALRHRWAPIQGTMYNECISAVLRLVLLVLLLRCGDVESNPGPNHDEKNVPVKKKIIKIDRVDRGQKIGIGVSSLEELRKKMLEKWPDLQDESYTLREQDGTEIEDEDYFLSLEHKSTLKLQFSEAGPRRIPQLDMPIGAPSPVTKRRLRDDTIYEIALNRLRSISKLGIAMGFDYDRVIKYEQQNSGLTECPGTRNMILDWRKEKVKTQDQVKEFCDVLKKAKQARLAEDLEKGEIFKGERTAQGHDMLQLQRELERYYVDFLCFTRTIPWKKDSAVQISDFFKPVSLFHREKTSKRDSRGCEESHRLAFTGKEQTGKTIGIFNSDDNPSSTETMTFLKSSHNDIFTVKQNGVCPRRFLVIGDPGVGKSTLLLKLAHDWAVASDSSPLKRVQILIHLTLKGVPLNANLGEEIKKQILPSDTTLDSDKIEQCIKESGDVVILLDGFDESEFASQPPNQHPEKCGSLYNTIKFDTFRNCRVLVTVRTWKESHFRGDLFNPYAVIFIGGLMPSSIKEFIQDYCNGKHASQIHSMINKDLTNLRPILRVPLFLAMICEMISDNTIIRAPFTLSNLINQFCKYLFEQFKDRYSELCQRDECLAGLGKLALNSYVLKMANVSGLIKDSLKVGLISKGRVKYSPEPGAEQEFYFAHSLLRDFCVAKYLSQSGYDMSSSIKEVVQNYYVLLFQCGLSGQTLGVLLNLLNETHPNPPPSKSLNPDLTGLRLPNGCTKELLAIQCYFENQNDTSEKFDIFSKLKCIAVPMDVLNALAAVEYLLSSRQESANNVSEFALLGENYVHIVDSHVQEDTDEYTLRVIHIDDICSLISKCSNVTLMYLADIKITLQQRSDANDVRKPLLCLAEIHVVDCGGYSDTFKSFLHHISTHFPALQFLGMQNMTFSLPPIQQQGVENDANFTSPSPEKLIKDDVISLLKDVAPLLEVLHFS